jgi:hypothetical protein
MGNIMKLACLGMTRTCMTSSGVLDTQRTLGFQSRLMQAVGESVHGDEEPRAGVQLTYQQALFPITHLQRHPDMHVDTARFLQNARLRETIVIGDDLADEAASGEEASGEEANGEEANGEEANGEEAKGEEAKACVPDSDLSQAGGAAEGRRFEEWLPTHSRGRSRSEGLSSPSERRRSESPAYSPVRPVSCDCAGITHCVMDEPSMAGMFTAEDEEVVKKALAEAVRIAAEQHGYAVGETAIDDAAERLRAARVAVLMRQTMLRHYSCEGGSRK